MSARIIETLEKWGLISTESVERLAFELPFRDIVKVREELEISLVEDTQRNANHNDAFNPFSFIASASLRGDSGCSSWHCRTRKAAMLARYAACFCDKVIVPLTLGSRSGHASQSEERYAFARALLAVVEMRPVINAGIVIPVASAFHYCPICFPRRSLTWSEY